MTGDATACWCATKSFDFDMKTKEIKLDGVIHDLAGFEAACTTEIHAYRSSGFMTSCTSFGGSVFEDGQVCRCGAVDFRFDPRTEIVKNDATIVSDLQSACSEALNALPPDPFAELKGYCGQYGDKSRSTDAFCYCNGTQVNYRDHARDSFIAACINGTPEEPTPTPSAEASSEPEPPTPTPTVEPTPSEDPTPVPTEEPSPVVE